MALPEALRILRLGPVSRRLLRDWREIEREPLPGVSAEPLQDEDGSVIDLFEWHGNITPPDGPYKGTVFHAILRFPTSYPVDPPSVELSVYIPHPNVFGHFGGAAPYICLDLLKSYMSKEPYVGTTPFPPTPNATTRWMFDRLE